MAILLNVQCFVYSPLHVRLRDTHALSYGVKGHLCVRGEAGLGTGYVYEAIARAHAYVHRLYNMQDKA